MILKKMVFVVLFVLLFGVPNSIVALERRRESSLVRRNKALKKERTLSDIKSIVQLHLNRFLATTANETKCQQCDSLVTVGEQSTDIYSTSTRANQTSSCASDIANWLQLKFAGMAILLAADLVFLFSGWLIALSCITNIGPYANNESCRSALSGFISAATLSILCLFLFPFNLIYGFLNCGRKTIFRPNGRIADMKSDLVATVLGLQGDRMLLDNADNAVETFLYDQMITTTNFLIDDLSQQYSDDQDVTDVNFYPVIRRCMESSLRGVTVRDIPKIMMEKYKLFSPGSMNTTNTISDYDIVLIIDSAMSTLPSDPRLMDASISFDFTDDDIIKMTRLSSTFFTGEDRKLLDGLPGDICTLQEELSCTAQSVVSSLSLVASSNSKNGKGGK